MKAVVNKRFQAEGKTLEPGTVVDVTDWPHLDRLVDQRRITLLPEPVGSSKGR